MHSPTLPFDYRALLLGIALSAIVFVAVVLVIRRYGRICGALLPVAFAWSLVVVAMVTLLPREPCQGPGCPVDSEPVALSCQWDISGGPMGLVQGGGVALNMLLFVPSGVLLGLAVLGAGRGRVLVPVGVAGLAAYSALIETAQRYVPQLDRHCDLTDVYQNIAGTVAGTALGVVVALVVLQGASRGRQ